MSESPVPRVLCTAYRPCSRNTLRGFAILEFIDISLRVRDCPHHVKALETGAVREWVGFPARPFEVDHERRWAAIVEVVNEVDKWRMSDACVRAVKAYLAEHPPASDWPFAPDEEVAS